MTSLQTVSIGNSNFSQWETDLDKIFIIWDDFNECPDQNRVGIDYESSSKMSSMRSTLVLLSLIAFASANVHTINVAKLLNDGAPIATDFKLEFLVEDIWDGNGENDPSIKITLKGDVPNGYKTITNSTVYFANDEKNIGRVTFGSGKVTMDSFRKPWNPEGEPIVVEIGAVLGYRAEFSFDPKWLPRNVTHISASSCALTTDDTYVIFNYYGIKNFAISLPDTMVVENFQAEDFTMVTP